MWLRVRVRMMDDAEEGGRLEMVMPLYIHEENR